MDNHDPCQHASYCATHNGPAYPPGPCNCGAEPEKAPLATFADLPVNAGEKMGPILITLANLPPDAVGLLNGVAGRLGELYEHLAVPDEEERPQESFEALEFLAGQACDRVGKAVTHEEFKATGVEVVSIILRAVCSPVFFRRAFGVVDKSAPTLALPRSLPPEAARLLGTLANNMAATLDTLDADHRDALVEQSAQIVGRPVSINIPLLSIGQRVATKFGLLNVDGALTRLPAGTEICWHLAPPPSEATITVALVGYPSEFDGPRGDALAAALSEIATERLRQDRRWGGPEHDDSHTAHQWAALLTPRANGAHIYSGNPYRRALVELASLAVAALQAHDRATPATGEDA